VRIALAAVGTRGDVQPVLALGRALRARGHDVRVCAPPNFRDWVTDVGLPFFAVGQDLHALVTGDWRDMVERPLSCLKGLEEMMRLQFDDLRKAAEGAEVIVGAGVQHAGPSVAAALDAPYFYAAFCPVVLRSAEHPAPLLERQDHPAWVNRLSWWACQRLFDWKLLRPLNRQREALGLARVRSTYAHGFGSGTMLLATDPLVAPAPGDARHPDLVTTGFWFLDEDEEDAAPLDPELQAFLDDGAPPVYVGFGSMPARDPERTTRAVVEAVLASRQRAVLHRGWAGLGAGDLPAQVHVVGSVPHARLFPRVSAVVHHGGAGTTAAALRAGVPQVVVPHVLDQFYWANRVHRIGVGPRAPSMRRLDTGGLARAIRTAAQSAGLRDRARELALQLDTRSGIPRAVDAIESVWDLAIDDAFPLP